jgi:hypothetical protein
MRDKSALEQECASFRRTIAELETQLKAVREYIATQERNLRNAADSVRQITERGLAEARSDLQLKELRLQQVRQDLFATQNTLTKVEAIAQRQQDIQTLERERDRINSLLERARLDVQQLTHEYQATVAPAIQPEYALHFTNGQHMMLTTNRSEWLIGCADPNVFPDIDLTSFGGTATGVSRRHALLRYANSGWTITDLNSTNGTWVNTMRLAPNVPVPLTDQAKLRFGGVDVVFGVQRQPVQHRG